MFVSAIEEVSKFTRPIHFVTRNYKNNTGTAGTATMFFVNELGVAITCKHVTDILGKVKPVKDQYVQFLKERNSIAKTRQFDRHLKELELKYQFTNDITVDIIAVLMEVTSEPFINYRWIDHPTFDLSILVLDNFKGPLYSSYAYFAKESSQLKQGKFLCRLGYPFPEFTNFEFDPAGEELKWKTTGVKTTPRFPIEGMLTRHVSIQGRIAGVELSTPGLRGQSGGPLFDKEATIYGMQVSTNHLHLGFDMKNHEIVSNGRKFKVDNQPFLHVGHCLHVDVIKEFLRQHNIKFYER